MKSARLQVITEALWLAKCATPDVVLKNTFDAILKDTIRKIVEQKKK